MRLPDHYSEITCPTCHGRKWHMVTEERVTPPPRERRRFEKTKVIRTRKRQTCLRCGGRGKVTVYKEVN